MTPQRWGRIREVFAAALELSGSARMDWVEQSCGDDLELRSEVESLLQSHDSAGTFIDRPVAELSPRSLAFEEPETIGAYRVLRRLGKGGMGVVYLAIRDDDTYSKQVAIKLLKVGFDSEELVARFRGERQILANLDHPNIARLVDGGTTESGRPYLVMDYVDATPVDRYCDAEKLATTERLRLFQKICGAVHFAHQNLVVHRDLKPNNILVTTAGEPKLLDFGIAKVLSPASFEQTVVVTAPGSVPMTPFYASPEQVKGEAITTASDVYSLGVVLFELLTGHPPYRLTTTTPAEVSRAVLTQEPGKPSTVILGERQVQTTGGTARTLTPATVAEVRDGDARLLRRRLAGDLDNIVLMALRKDPRRRYNSAAELSRDIGRFLDDKPVVARPDTLGYRTGKFVRRHRASVSAALIALAALVGVLLLLLVQRVRIVEERNRAEAVSSVLTELFALPDPTRARGESVTARELLDRGSSQIAADLADQPKVLADFQATMGESYKNLALYDEAQPLLESALDLHRETQGTESPNAARGLQQLAELHTLRGDYGEAERLNLEALRLFRSLHGDDGVAVARSLRFLARIHDRAGDFPAARRHYQQALETSRRIDDPFLTATVLDRYATLLSKLQQVTDEGAGPEEMFREALELYDERFAGLHPEAAMTMNNLALLVERRDFEEAEALLLRAETMQRKLFDTAHPQLATTLHNLGGLLHRQGRYSEAQERFEEAIAILRQVHAGPHPELASTLSNFGDLQLDRGKLDEAEALHREALETLVTLVGRDHPDTAESLTNLARLEVRRKDRTAARALFEEALEITRTHFGPRHPRVAVLLNNLADLASWNRDFERGEELFEQAISITRASLGEDHPNVAVALYNLASLQRRRGGEAAVQAEANYLEAIRIARARLGESHPNLGAMCATRRASLGRVRRWSPFRLPIPGIPESSR